MQIHLPVPAAFMTEVSVVSQPVIPFAAVIRRRLHAVFQRRCRYAHLKNRPHIPGHRRPVQQRAVRRIQHLRYPVDVISGHAYHRPDTAGIRFHQYHSAFPQYRCFPLGNLLQLPVQRQHYPGFYTASVAHLGGASDRLLPGIDGIAHRYFAAPPGQFVIVARLDAADAPVFSVHIADYVRCDLLLAVSLGDMNHRDPLSRNRCVCPDQGRLAALQERQQRCEFLLRQLLTQRRERRGNGIHRQQRLLPVVDQRTQGAIVYGAAYCSYRKGIPALRRRGFLVLLALPDHEYPQQYPAEQQQQAHMHPQHPPLHPPLHTQSSSRALR